MDVSVNSKILDQLNTEEAKLLHQTSNDLSACGVGKIVNLPRIIVVGEQSSGKSSVLEAISCIKFPVDGGVCTRFATELIFHRANETRIDASVIFSDTRKPSQTFQRKRFHHDDLPDIIKEAREYMGFSSDEDFSKDVLRLEIEGPNMSPLSLVDLPGLYQTNTMDQSLQGKDTVDELVESYMRQNNSIILVVLPANINLANQAALHKAQMVDPQRRRSIGVITKPDLALTANANQYIGVAKNQETSHKLQLGWHVLRNRGEDETSLATRDEIEESFFKTRVDWATIPDGDRGIANFRKKLSVILFNHIRNSLPGVIGDIETKLRDRENSHAQLGDKRSTAEQCRSYLLTISNDFQRLARDGCNGRYNDPFFGGLEGQDLKFRALLRNFNRVFDHNLRTKGSTQKIVLSDEDEPKEDELPQHLARFLNQYPYDFPDPERITIEELSNDLENKAAINQGREFPGYPNTDLAMQLFQNQAAPWKQIAQFHVDTVATVAKAFVDQLFKHVVGSPQNNSTTEAILATCVDPFFEEKEELLRDKINELLRPYSQGFSLPVDIEFYGALSQKTTSRVANQICKTLKEKYPELFNQGSKNMFTPEKITQAMALDQNARVGQFGTDKIIDMMMTYYEMSRRTFTDNVINLAVESCLVCSIPDILTPKQVGDMDTDRLTHLAGEAAEITSRRTLLEREIKILKDGLATCRKYRLRAITALPSSRPSAWTSISATSAPSTTSNSATPVSAASVAVDPSPAAPVPASVAVDPSPAAPVPASVAVASNPVSNPRASAPPSLLAAANTTAISELPSGSTTINTNIGAQGQAPCSATNSTTHGRGDLPGPGTVIPNSNPGQNTISASTSSSGGPNVFSSPGLLGSTSRPPGGKGSTVSPQEHTTAMGGSGTS